MAFVRDGYLMALFRILVRTGQGPLWRAWLAGYRAAAWCSAAYLTRHERDTTAYVRAGVASGDFLPGLSDIDLLLVCDPDPGQRGAAALRIHARREHLAAVSRPASLLLDSPIVIESDELPELVGANTLTFGLSGTSDPGESTIYAGDPARADRIRLAERPGLYSSTADWSHLRGRRRDIREAGRSPAEITLAAWLELVFWWRIAFPACGGGLGPRGGYLAAKLISEPARIWLLLAHGERYARRTEALERAIECLPDEEDAFLLGLELHRTAAELPPLQLELVLPPFVRLSDRIADLVRVAATAAGETEAELCGNPSELTPHRPGAPTPPPEALPLCDWRALVSSTHGDEWFVKTAWDVHDPAAIERASGMQDNGAHFALRSGSLLVFPGPTFVSTRQRGIESPATDPVTFALADGRSRAAFPNHPGLSLDDVTRRAVAERRAWVERADREPTVTELLLAARAALARESLLRGEPRIPVTLAATARQLGERSATARTVTEASLDELGRPRADPAATAALRSLVTALPGLERS